MSYNPIVDHGISDYNSIIQIPDNIVTGEGISTDPSLRKFARITMDVSNIPMNEYVVTSGSYTYIGVAPTGTPTVSAIWRCKRIYNVTSAVLTQWLRW